MIFNSKTTHQERVSRNMKELKVKERKRKKSGAKVEQSQWKKLKSNL